MDIRLESISVETFAGIVLFLIALLVFRLLPIIVKRVSTQTDLTTEGDKHDLQVEKAEANLAFDAKTFLNQQAKEYVDTIKEFADKSERELKALNILYQESLISRADLTARDALREDEIEKLEKIKKEFDKLTVSVGSMERENILLKNENERLLRTNAEVEGRLEFERNENLKLTRNIGVFTEQTRVKDNRIRELEFNVKQIETERDKLRRKLFEYVGRLKQKGKLTTVEMSILHSEDMDDFDTEQIIAVSPEEPK